MRVAVKKWGNSASVRIPASVMQAAKVDLNQVVDVRVEKGRIVIDPVRPPKYDVDKLIAAISPENLHEPVDFGPPAGKEAW
jgi:antitoxin MazE